MRQAVLSMVFGILAFGTPASAQVFPTPKWIEWCEAAIADLQLRSGPYSDDEAKAAVITLYACDERRLLDRGTKLRLMESSLAPYFEAYSADPKVWRK